jgi:diguanylate cyclase (GGDEF)-like protein/PAS domain S-box-containing protein
MVGRDSPRNGSRRPLSASFLTSVFEATDDGLLVVDDDGRIRHYNRRFAEIWGLPEEVLEDRSDRKALEYAKDRLADPEPERFVDGVEEIYEREDVERRDHLEFEDGRVIERYTRPVEQDGETIGRVWSFRDVTERAETMARLEASEQRYRALLEQNVAGVFRSTVDGEWVDCNEAFASIFGYDSPEALMDTPVEELYPSPGAREALLEELRREEAVYNHELRLERKDGEPVHVLENSRLLGNHGTGRPEIIGTVIDITQRKRLRDRLEEMALHDELTGLPNRRLLRERADQALTLADRRGGKVGLLYIDLVSFKMVNDSLGHTAGDRVLAAVAKQLDSRARQSDTPARVGGDEFVVLLPEVEDEEDLRAAARRFAEIFETPFPTPERAVHLDGRMGGALYPDHAGDFDRLLSNADRALTRGRREDEDVTLAHEAGDAEDEDELALAEALRGALDRDELEVHYQPIVRPGDSEAIGVQALVRWRRGEELLTAGQFLATAERIGVVRDIDRWVLERVAAQIAAWEARGPFEWVGVNLSARTFNEPGLPDRIRGLLEERGVDGSRLVVEITERAALRDPDRTRETIEQLRDAGVRIAIDDFGTGYSAVAHLKRYAADMLKVDMVFTDEFGREGGNVELGEAILELGHASGVEVVAEGIERPEQSRWVADSDFDYAQGFHYARPGPPSEIEAEVGTER